MATASGASSAHEDLGMTNAEYEAVCRTLGRSPSSAELAMYSVMWSEHCSYKSSRTHLRRFPTNAPQVIMGPGENAGIVDAGDGLAVAIRMESHNHPSAIEPKQGAATGVGGIIRDILSVGARPVALLDPLFFGPLTSAHSRLIFDGVIRGISSYGNSVGVPTVGGELTFDPCYERNPLVNVVCVGVVEKNRIIHATASRPGSLAVLLGSLTGRDGIGGVSVLASAGFGDVVEDKRPSVQVGDPFEGKRLIEACLELADRGLILGLQDLGGAGLSCATCETASKGGMGMEVDVTAVPLREPGMDPMEILVSESQERMLAIVSPDRLGEVKQVCDRHEVRHSVVGRVVPPAPDAVGRLRVQVGEPGERVVDVPAASLADGAPLYDRPVAPPATARPEAGEDPDELPEPPDPGGDLLAMLQDASYVYEQYDYMLFHSTIAGPGSGAALLRLAVPGKPPTAKAIALSADSNHRLCALDPRLGARHVVAESALNVACVGAVPWALVDCLNFGNPEHPEVMWQFSETVDGITEACNALSVPVVGGNVSFYNESAGRDIDPTPVVTMLGLREVAPAAGSQPWSMREGDHLALLGNDAPQLGGSRWAVDLHGKRGGRPPSLDLEFHARLVRLTVALAIAGMGSVSYLQDVSDGGLAVALAEIALFSGVGVTANGIADNKMALFGESFSRVIVATNDIGSLQVHAEDSGVPCRIIGQAEGGRIRIGGSVDLDLEDAAHTRRSRLQGQLTA